MKEETTMDLEYETDREINLIPKLNANTGTGREWLTKYGLLRDKFPEGGDTMGRENSNVSGGGTLKAHLLEIQEQAREKDVKS